MDAGCCGIQIPEPRVSLTNERLSLPGRLVWGNGSEELGDGADGRPDHRRRVRRSSNDAARETPVAAPRSLQRDARAGDGLEDAGGAPQVAARRPGRGRPGSWAWRHHPPTAACSGEQTQPKELVLSRGRQGLTDHMRSRDLQFFFSEHAGELRIFIKKSREAFTATRSGK